jgi:molecular chaperone GrpE
VNTETSNPNIDELPSEPVASAAGETEGTETNAERDRLVAERDQFAREKAESLDRLLRLQAEFDNFRKRSEKDRSEFVQYAGMEILRDLLPVLDNFELALKSECASKEYSKGVEMIYQRMADTMKKMGLEPIEAEGKPFDPHVHQAVERVPTEEFPEDAVISEFQRGYRFKGKLLRPSMVKVAVRPT